MKNYFNYFTEVEEHFVRKRGKSLLVSPLDWCLIELWRGNGIPLHVVLRGIDRSFESAQNRQKKTPRTLFYCHPAIIEAFEEYNQAMLGASNEKAWRQEVPGSSGDFSKEAVLDYLRQLENRLKKHQSEVFGRAAERVLALKSEVSSRPKGGYQELDRDLADIGVMLAESLQQEMGAEKVKELQAEVKKEMKIYRKRLSKEMYKRLETNYVDRKILALYDLPEFSLLALAGRL